MGFAKHLAVIYGRCAASAPSGDVVSIHLFKFIYASPIVVVSEVSWLNHYAFIDMAGLVIGHLCVWIISVIINRRVAS